MDYTTEENIRDILTALDTIKNVCKASYHCDNCPFMKDSSCYIKYVDPEKWEINSSYIWRAFK